MEIFSEVELNRFDQIGISSDSPLHLACYEGNIEEVKMMLDSSLNVDIKGDIGNTPLHEAVINSHLEIVKLLLRAGANPTLVNNYGDTVFDFVEQPSGAIITKILTESSRNWAERH